MASDDTPRTGESASGIAYSTERELKTLLSGQISFLRDTLAQAERADDLEETERALRELGQSAQFLADVIGEMRDSEE